jgi:PAS domain S-box-containing protein
MCHSPLTDRTHEARADTEPTAAPVAAWFPQIDERETSEFLDRFLALMPDAAVVVDGDGRIVRANPFAAELFRYGPGDLAGRPVELVVPERLRARHRAHRRTYAAAPKARPMGAGQELTGRRQDGSEFPVDISLAPLGGDLVIAAVRDASDRHAAQHAQSQLATIVESSVDGILSLSLEGRILSWNPGAEQLFGYDFSEVVGTHVSCVVPDDSSPDLEELLEAALSGTPAPPRDTAWQCRDGSFLDVAMSISPLKDSAGQTTGFSALLRDVTERKRRERQLAATAAVRTGFLSGASIDDCLQLLCDEARTLVSAGSCALVLVANATARVFDGTTIREAPADLLPAPGSAARQVLDAATPHIATAVAPVDGGADDPAQGPVLGVPVVSSRGTDGALVMARGPGEAGFVDGDVDLLGALADQAALGIELGRARDERERALRIGDRERIGRDLHDLVIQRIFAIGMDLQGIARLNNDPAVSDRVERAVEALDATISEIRSTLFRLDDG